MRALDDLVQLQQPHVAGALLGEHQQPLREPGGTLRGVERGLQIGLRFTRSLRLCQADRADNRGQQVVEVVRDPACQAPHRFEPLRLRELMLQLLAPRDVLNDADQRQRLAVLVALHLAAALDPHHLAVG